MFFLGSNDSYIYFFVVYHCSNVCILLMKYNNGFEEMTEEVDYILLKH